MIVASYECCQQSQWPRFIPYEQIIEISYEYETFALSFRTFCFLIVEFVDV